VLGHRFNIVEQFRVGHFACFKWIVRDFAISFVKSCLRRGKVLYAERLRIVRTSCCRRLLPSSAFAEVCALWVLLWLECERGISSKMRVYLFAVESLGRVERLNESGGVTDEQRIARGSGQHADHGQPDVGRTLRRVPAEPDAQHVWQRLEQCPCVLLRPLGMLKSVSKSYRSYTRDAPTVNQRYSNEGAFDDDFSVFV